MRKFNDRGPITYCFKARTNPLIKIGVDRELSYYNTLQNKLVALKERTEHDKFILAWCGQWRTDVFEVNEDDIALVIKEYA